MLARERLRISHDLIAFLVKGGDVFIVALAGALAYLWRFQVGGFPIPLSYSMLMLAAALLLLVIFSALGVYRSWRGGNLAHMFSRVLLGWASVMMILLVLLFMLKATDAYSRIWLSTWAVLTGALLLSERFALYHLLRWFRLRGRNHKNVVMVGKTEVARELIQRIRTASWTGFDVVALFDDQAPQTAAFEGIPLKQDLGEIETYLREHSVSEVWITLPLKDEARVREALHHLRHSTVNIRYVPDIFAFRLINHGVSEVAGMPMLDLSTTPMTGVNRLIKALEDRLLGTIILILISPLFLGIALAVKLSSPGPVLFKQKRHGWDGREITVYKFRSMVVHAEDSGQVTQARKADPRITRIGAILRRTSLDELPQFINVLQGRMSIVGPRPHALAHNEQYKDLVEAYMQRHKVKPGITGWAQVNGYRGETDTLEKMQKRVEYDLYYIEHWSIWFDLKIIFLTIFKGFINQNAR
ncbi:MAG: undecaprenyl-phosphate glucose phosphotransferase [Thermodesulfobacteriota bacterium]